MKSKEQLLEEVAQAAWDELSKDEQEMFYECFGVTHENCVEWYLSLIKEKKV